MRLRVPPSGQRCACGSRSACDCDRRRGDAARDALRAESRPLDPSLRAALEPRFAHDFSRVRIHSGAAAETAAREFGARAFTIGNDIVVGGAVGNDVLTHELAHVVQQQRAAAAGSFTTARISAPEDATEREADRAAQTIAGRGPMLPLHHAPLHIARIPITPPAPFVPSASAPRPSAPPVPRGPLDVDPNRPLPARGPNPAGCLAPICPSLRATALNLSALHQAVNRWRDDSIACIRGGATASGASHAAQIVANDVAEYTSQASDIINNLHDPRDVRDALSSSCTEKQREVEIEFRHNVIIDTQGGATIDLDRIDEGLQALPEDATWGNLVAMTFRGESLPPPVMGETSPSRGQSTATIAIDPAATSGGGGGLYSTLGLNTGVATVRHEVAHVVQDHTPQAVLDELFRLLEWNDWTLAHLRATPAAHPEWATQRAAARARAGGSESDFDAFLATLDAALLAIGGNLSTTPIERGGFDWVVKPGGTPLVVSYRTGRVSRSPEFAYARSNRGDYFSEIYTFATSLPEWLHDQLPADVTAWWKRAIFNVPVDRDEWVRQLGTAPRTVPPTVLDRIARRFTWPQIRPLIDPYLTAPRPDGGTLV